MINEILKHLWTCPFSYNHICQYNSIESKKSILSSWVKYDWSLTGIKNTDEWKEQIYSLNLEQIKTLKERFDSVSFKRCDVNTSSSNLQKTKKIMFNSTNNNIKYFW